MHSRLCYRVRKKVDVVGLKPTDILQGGITALVTCVSSSCRTHHNTGSQ